MKQFWALLLSVLMVTEAGLSSSGWALAPASGDMRRLASVADRRREQARRITTPGRSGGLRQDLLRASLEGLPVAESTPLRGGARSRGANTSASVSVLWDEADETALAGKSLVRQGETEELAYEVEQTLSAARAAANASRSRIGTSPAQRSTVAESLQDLEDWLEREEVQDREEEQFLAWAREQAQPIREGLRANRNQIYQLETASYKLEDAIQERQAKVRSASGQEGASLAAGVQALDQRRRQLQSSLEENYRQLAAGTERLQALVSQLNEEGVIMLREEALLDSQLARDIERYKHQMLQDRLGQYYDLLHRQGLSEQDAQAQIRRLLLSVREAEENLARQEADFKQRAAKLEQLLHEQAQEHEAAMSALQLRLAGAEQRVQDQDLELEEARATLVQSQQARLAASRRIAELEDAEADAQEALRQERARHADAEEALQAALAKLREGLLRLTQVAAEDKQSAMGEYQTALLRVRSSLEEQLAALRKELDEERLRHQLVEQGLSEQLEAMRQARDRALQEKADTDRIVERQAANLRTRDAENRKLREDLLGAQQEVSRLKLQLELKKDWVSQEVLKGVQSSLSLNERLLRQEREEHEQTKRTTAEWRRKFEEQQRRANQLDLANRALQGQVGSLQSDLEAEKQRKAPRVSTGGISEAEVTRRLQVQAAQLQRDQEQAIAGAVEAALKEQQARLAREQDEALQQQAEALERAKQLALEEQKRSLQAEFDRRWREREEQWQRENSAGDNTLFLRETPDGYRLITDAEFAQYASLKEREQEFDVEQRRAEQERSEAEEALLTKIRDLEADLQQARAASGQAERLSSAARRVSQSAEDAGEEEDLVARLLEEKERAQAVVEHLRFVKRFNIASDLSQRSGKTERSWISLEQQLNKLKRAIQESHSLEQIKALTQEQLDAYQVAARGRVPTYAQLEKDIQTLLESVGLELLAIEQAKQQVRESEQARQFLQQAAEQAKTDLEQVAGDVKGPHNILMGQGLQTYQDQLRQLRRQKRASVSDFASLDGANDQALLRLRDRRLVAIKNAWYELKLSVYGENGATKAKIDRDKQAYEEGVKTGIIDANREISEFFGEAYALVEEWVRDHGEEEIELSWFDISEDSSGSGVTSEEEPGDEEEEEGVFVLDGEPEEFVREGASLEKDALTEAEEAKKAELQEEFRQPGNVMGQKLVAYLRSADQKGSTAGASHEDMVDQFFAQATNSQSFAQIKQIIRQSTGWVETPPQTEDQFFSYSVIEATGAVEVEQELAFQISLRSGQLEVSLGDSVLLQQTLGAEARMQPLPIAVPEKYHTALQYELTILADLGRVEAGQRLLQSVLTEGQVLTFYLGDNFESGHKFHGAGSFQLGGQAMRLAENAFVLNKRVWDGGDQWQAVMVQLVKELIRSREFQRPTGASEADLVAEAYTVSFQVLTMLSGNDPAQAAESFARAVEQMVGSGILSSAEQVRAKVSRADAVQQQAVQQLEQMYGAQVYDLQQQMSALMNAVAERRQADVNTHAQIIAVVGRAA